LAPFELALVLLSGLLHAAWNAATKGSDSPIAFLLAMELASLVFFAPIALVPAGADFGTLVHAVYAYWLSRTYALAELSVAYPIVRSTPAVVPLLAIPLLGESISVVGAVGIALVVASLWAVTAGGPIGAQTLRSRGTGFAFLTLGTTVAYSLIDKEGMRVLGESPWTSPVPRAVVYMTLMYVFYLPWFAFLARRSVRASDVAAVVRRRAPMVFGAAAIAFISYSLVLHAMQTAPVSYITAARQASVLFALVIAVAVLRERPGRIRILGGIANVAGVALIALAD